MSNDLTLTDYGFFDLVDDVVPSDLDNDHLGLWWALLDVVEKEAKKAKAAAKEEMFFRADESEPTTKGHHEVSFLDTKWVKQRAVKVTLDQEALESISKDRGIYDYLVDRKLTLRGEALDKVVAAFPELAALVVAEFFTGAALETTLAAYHANGILSDEDMTAILKEEERWSLQMRKKPSKLKELRLVNKEK